MNDHNPQVSTAQIARQAVNRLESEAAQLGRQVREYADHVRQREDALRELLEYVEAQQKHAGYALTESAYEDCATRLRQILDGPS
jgi:predicted nuclease with TOPRIM domain